MKAAQQRGFTLIEVAVACSVSAVLAAVALPSYTTQVQKARRADALAGMALVQHAQERYRSRNPQYAAALVDLGLNSTSAGPRYTLSLVSVSGVGYTVKAISNAATDAACATLQVSVLRSVQTRSATTASGATSSQACFPQ
jgi:type IV pilus assembly protein PilE